MGIPMVLLGSQLAAGRRFTGLSQGDLAQLTSVHRGTINRWERYNARPVDDAHPLLLQAIVDELVRRGVEFLPDGGVVCRSVCQGGV